MFNLIYHGKEYVLILHTQIDIGTIDILRIRLLGVSAESVTLSAQFVADMACQSPAAAVSMRIT